MGAMRKAFRQVEETGSVWEAVGDEAITNGVRLTGSFKLKGIPAFFVKWLGLDLSVEFDTVVKLGKASDAPDESPGPENAEAGGN